MNFESQCIHAGYQPKNGEACALPIVQSTTFRYESTAEVAKLFDLTENGFFYTRLGNPTMDAVEQKIAALEGGVGALLTSTGQAAALTAVATICKAGDHIVASSSIYGGTFNLLGVTLKRFGISVTFVDQRASDEEIEKAFRPETRAVFGETIANPALTVFDIERFAALAHKHGVPLIVDNTFATPYLCRPFEYGADIIVHSTTKYMEGQAVQMGGVVVDSGRFDWTSGKFPEFTDPDPSYHGTVYTKAFGKAAFIVKARVQIMRDLGCCQTPQGAFYLNMGLQTATAATPNRWPPSWKAIRRSSSSIIPASPRARITPSQKNTCPKAVPVSFPSPSGAAVTRARVSSTASGCAPSRCTWPTSAPACCIPPLRRTVSSLTSSSSSAALLPAWSAFPWASKTPATSSKTSARLSARPSGSPARHACLAPADR